MFDALLLVVIIDEKMQQPKRYISNWTVTSNQLYIEYHLPYDFQAVGKNIKFGRGEGENKLLKNRVGKKIKLWGPSYTSNLGVGGVKVDWWLTSPSSP